MMYGYGFSMIGGIVMMLFWALIIAGIVWAVVAVTRSARLPGETAPQNESPLDILKRRYAAGEINSEQFAELKRNLGY